MTTSSRKNYNENALRGGTYDDMEYVERYDLDPAVAYTPKINDAMLDAVMQEAIDDGMPIEQAKKNRMSAAKRIAKLMS